VSRSHEEATAGSHRSDRVCTFREPPRGDRAHWSSGDDSAREQNAAAASPDGPRHGSLARPTNVVRTVDEQRHLGGPVGRPSTPASGEELGTSPAAARRCGRAASRPGMPGAVISSDALMNAHRLRFVAEARSRSHRRAARIPTAGPPRSDVSRSSRGQGWRFGFSVLSASATSRSWSRSAGKGSASSPLPGRDRVHSRAL